jgi:hypothetical protein
VPRCESSLSARPSARPSLPYRPPVTSFRLQILLRNLETRVKGKGTGTKPLSSQRDTVRDIQPPAGRNAQFLSAG